MATVQEVLNLALEVDMVGLAHRVFWTITKGEVALDDPAEVLETIECDEEAISEMVKRNYLQMGKIKLFGIETPQPGLFAFYYSENVLEAHAFHQQIFREAPKRVTEAPHLMTELFHFEKGGSDILYFCRKGIVSFPFYLGHARAGERVLYKLDSFHNYGNGFYLLKRDS